MKTLLLLAYGVAITLGQDPKILDNFSSRNIRYFADDLYSVLGKLSSDNFVVCPLSAFTILAAVHTAATGATAKELEQVLRISNDTANVRTTIFELQQYLQSNERYTLTNANHIYATQNIQLGQRFAAIAARFFDIQCQSIDFTKNEEAAFMINKWVEEKTLNKVKDLMKPELLNEDTSVILVSTMYFKANWLYTFSSKDTFKDIFYINSTNQVIANMMKMRSYFNYYVSPELNAHILELPYEEEDITMTLILPAFAFGLSYLEKDFRHATLKPPYQLVDVNVIIPKFEIETAINLKPIMKQLGVTKLFHKDEASLPGLARGSNTNIYISEAIQKVFIGIHEKGSTDDFLPDELYLEDKNPAQYTFHANHPFMFFLSHKITGIIFIGRVVRP